MLPIKKEKSVPIRIERMPIAIEQLPALPQVETATWVINVLVNFGETSHYFEVQLLVGNLIETSVHLQLVGNWLVIKGATQTPEAKGMCWHVHEIVTGFFEKRFFLHHEVIEEKVVAYYANGILSIILPKKNYQPIADSVIQYW